MLRLENISKISLQDVLKMSWRRLEDVLKRSWRGLEEVLKTSWQDILKTSSRRLEDVFIKTNVFWEVIWSVLRISASSCWLNIVFFCVALLNKILERNNNMAETAAFKIYGWNSYLSKTVHWFTQLVKNVKLV